MPVYRTTGSEMGGGRGWGAKPKASPGKKKAPARPVGMGSSTTRRPVGNGPTAEQREIQRMLDQGKRPYDLLTLQQKQKWVELQPLYLRGAELDNLVRRQQENRLLTQVLRHAPADNAESVKRFLYPWQRKRFVEATRAEARRRGEDPRHTETRIVAEFDPELQRLKKEVRTSNLQLRLSPIVAGMRTMASPVNFAKGATASYLSDQDARDLEGRNISGGTMFLNALRRGGTAARDDVGTERVMQAVPSMRNGWGIAYGVGTDVAGDLSNVLLTPNAVLKVGRAAKALDAGRDVSKIGRYVALSRRAEDFANVSRVGRWAKPGQTVAGRLAGSAARPILNRIKAARAFSAVDPRAYAIERARQKLADAAALRRMENGNPARPLASLRAREEAIAARKIAGTSARIPASGNPATIGGVVVPVVRKSGQAAVAGTDAIGDTSRIPGQAGGRITRQTSASPPALGVSGTAAPSGGQGRRARVGSLQAPPPDTVVSPFQSSVTDRQALANLNRNLRMAGVDVRANPRTVIRRADGSVWTLGQKSFDDWVRQVETNRSPAAIAEDRDWYRVVGGRFNELHGQQSPLFLNALWASQQNLSVPLGYQDVLRAADGVFGGRTYPGTLHLAHDKVYAALRNTPPTRGFGPKLNDFTDSGMGKTTRTFLRDDPRGGQPFTVDVWTSRDYGLVDSQTLSRLEAEFGQAGHGGVLEVDGKDVPFHFEITQRKASDIPGKSGQPLAGRFVLSDGRSIPVRHDLSGSPSPKQYEAASHWGNELARHLDASGYRGQSWTAPQAQATGWMAVSKAHTGRPAADISEALRYNTRRVSFELEFDPHSPLAKEYPSLLTLKPAQAESITRQVLQGAVDDLTKRLKTLYGARVDQMPGGAAGERGARPSWHVAGVMSPETAQLLSAHLGASLNQRENYLLRFLLPDDPVSNARRFYAASVQGVDLSDLNAASEVYAIIQQEAPRLAQGFQVIRRPDGTTALVAVNDPRHGRWNIRQFPEDLRRVEDALEQRFGQGKVRIDEGHAKFDATRHPDWASDPTGSGHFSSIREQSPWGELEESWNRDYFQGRVRELVDRAYRDIAPEELARFRAGARAGLPVPSSPRPAILRNGLRER